MRILLPLDDSNSMTHSSNVADGAAISSTNAGFADLRRSLVTPLSQFHRRLPQLLGQFRSRPLRAPKLIQLELQLRDGFGNRCGLGVHR